VLPSACTRFGTKTIWHHAGADYVAPPLDTFVGKSSLVRQLDASIATEFSTPEIDFSEGQKLRV